MERRLTNAYDRMTMPEDCARRIEDKLQMVSQEKKLGRFTRIVAPERPGKSRWLPAAAAAACLVLAFFAGGSLLSRQAAPADPVVTTPEETIQTPEDHYSAVTDIPAEEVEAFAKIIQYNMLQRNWEPLHSKVQFPVTIQDEEVTDFEAFDEWMDAFSRYYVYTDRMEQETCRAMFCNWQGISVANGLFWINEVGGELKITAIDVEIQEKTEETVQKKQVPEAFAQVLFGEKVNFYGIRGKKTLAEHCADMWGEVIPTRFAVVDMDADDVCEIVICARTAAGEDGGYLVLRQDGENICAYPFKPAELLDLKKDGSFFRRDREHRLVFHDKTSCLTLEVLGLQQELPPAQWHAWPCLRPDLLLQSYEYVTGTGWSSFPGHPYYLFEGLAMERAGNAMDVLEYWMKSAVCVQEENSVYIFDPDAPGTAFYGTLTEEAGFAQFSQVGYYISTEEREYQAEIRNMLSEEPEYWADVHLPSFMGTFGRMVSTPEELAAYFGYTPMPDAETMKQTRELKALIRELTLAYMEGGSEAMEPYLAETYQNRQKKFFPEDAEIRLMTYGTMPDRVVEAGERIQTGAGVLLVGDDKDYSFNLELVKEASGWKVEVYYLYISEE